jgi:hypothetical protein
MTSSDDKKKIDWDQWKKDFSSALAGKPNYHREEMKVDPVPVSVITSDLVKIPEDHWWKYAFAREPLNEKFDDASRKDLMNQAIACGREYAEKITAKCGSDDPILIAKQLGLDVDYPEQPQNGHRVLFAEYRDPNVVHIYTDGTRRGEELLKDSKVKEDLENIDLNRILLSHEIFHWVEKEYESEIWTRTYEIELWKVGKFTNHSHIACLSEIAAMAFAKKLMKISYSPYVIDAFLDYAYSPKAATALYQEMMADDNRMARSASKPKEEDQEDVLL